MNPKLRRAMARAIERLSLADMLVAWQDEDFTAEDLPELIGLLERCGRLLFRDANPNGEAERDAFLTGLTDEVDRRFGSEPHALIEGVRDLMHQIEAGYRDVADGLETAAISALPLDRQIAAILERAASEADDVRRRGIEAIEREPELVVGEPVVAHDEWGGRFHADATITGLVENLGAYLKMIGRSQLAQTSDGRLLLPLSTAESSEDERFKAGTSGLSAMARRRWQVVEERRRFWGGELRNYTKPDLPLGVAPTLEVIREHVRAKGDLFDWVANERLKDVFQRQWDHADRTGPPAGGFKGIDDNARLPPAEIISPKEYVAVTALRGLLGHAAFDEGALFQGLTLYEWVRGYAALSSLADLAYRNGSTPGERSLVSFAPGELVERLSKLGLLNDRAVRFVDQVTLNTRSDDIFDCPLLASTEGGHVLFGPAAIDVVLGRVLLSNLSALGETFQKKGAWFEQDVLALFRKLGFSAFNIDSKIGSERYQIDVVVPWAEYLFVFECKNEGLSGYQPVAAYNFEQSRLEHCFQLERQIEGMKLHPQLSTDRGGPDPNSRTVVPVLLYRFPYARISKDGEIVTADWSALTRFFQHRGEINLTVRHEHGDEVAHEDRPVFKMWSGKVPSAADFVRHLRQPIQVASMMGRLDMKWSDFWLRDHRVATTLEFFRAPSDLDRVAAALGADAKQLRRGIRKMRNKISAGERRRAEKLLLRQTRTWRHRRDEA